MCVCRYELSQSLAYFTGWNPYMRMALTKRSCIVLNGHSIRPLVWGAIGINGFNAKLQQGTLELRGYGVLGVVLSEDAVAIDVLGQRHAIKACTWWHTTSKYACVVSVRIKHTPNTSPLAPTTKAFRQHLGARLSSYNQDTIKINCNRFRC